MAAVPPDHPAAAGARARDHAAAVASCSRSRSSRRRRCVGEPSGSTRVLSIAAYHAAFEDYDYSMGSAIAMIMGAVELAVVGLLLGARRASTAVRARGGEGMTPRARRPRARRGLARVGRRRRSSSSTCRADRRGRRRTRSAPAGSTPGCPRAYHQVVLRRVAEFALSHVLIVTFEVALAVIAISLLVGVPAAYALARRQFPGKRAVMLLLLLPLVLPPLTYGIPFATLLYELASRRDAERRDPRQPRAGDPVRDPRDDAVHRADRPERRVGGADVRREHAAVDDARCSSRC